MKKTKLLFLTLFIANYSYAQSTLMDSLIQKNYTTFQKNNNNSFEGKGWTNLKDEMTKSNSVVLGEFHFQNEIPYFTNAIINSIKFDNYFLEVDPYLVKILEEKIKTLSPDELNKFIKEYGNQRSFSFLSQEAEFDLLKNIIKHQIKPYGVEQVSLFSDRVIISELNKHSKNAKAKVIYKQMMDNSKAFDRKKNTEFYFFSKDFSEKLNALTALNLSANEKEQIEAIKLSQELYLNRIHRLRVQLLKHLTLQKLPEWKDKKNLFKFGAGHSPKGESLLEVYDIGNLVSNIEDGNYRKSLHVMVMGKEEGETLADLEMYKSFLTVVKDNNWYNYDLRPLKEAISKNKLKVDNLELERIIKGYDYLVYIPNLTKMKNFGE
ncbi:hypothetical protein [Pedobacter gandavensis]|uniref:Haem-binding uptake Tiki superfamily ChaN domain-containing protein n=1 Tax=Pedobacter gandavensis TaxID=2679963 RepID=A0ABR6ES74_9SPHI|nr:hypothetical protein [Pedobacter gandavensis]MBB2148101.1 hypothetical protein [Pedobacter gandavensis]